MKLNRICRAPGLFATLAASAALACGGSGTEPNQTVKVSAVIIDQGSFAIERGYHAPLTATVKDDAGQTVPVPVVWRSSVEKIATLDANGRLAALDTGITIVTASTLGVTSQPIAVKVVWQGAAKIETYQFTPPAAASASATVPDSIRVRVLDLKGNPVAGVRVAFAVAVGGGTVTPAIDTTDRNGVVAAQWTLGNSNGANQVTASVINDDDKPLTFVDGSPATFVVTAFDAVHAVDGDNQTGQILAKLPVSPSVKVVDVNGNPRPGVPVTFTPTAGGRVTTSVVSTGADGVASPGSWTLGDVTGDQQLVVTVEAAKFVMHATGTGTAVLFFPTIVSAGGFATCAITQSGTVSCMGQQPLVGDGSGTNRTSPTSTNGGVSFTALSGSPTHFCGVAVDQSIWCWGYLNNPSDPTFATLRSNPTPQQLTSSVNWTVIASGYTHNCAIATNGPTYCWGNNGEGELGDRTTTGRLSPDSVYGGYRFSALASGSHHSCGLASGAAFCWGLNANGQLGDGTKTNRLNPTAVSGGQQFMAIGAGEAMTCALSTAGRAYCWGSISAAATQQTTPKDYPNAPTFSQLTVGGGHACALTGDGTAWCWGNNSVGQLGDSTTVNRADPVPVAGGLKFRSISAGYEHTCAQTLDGSVACWGLNSVGELGDSVTGPRLVPRYVVVGVNP